MLLRIEIRFNHLSSTIHSTKLAKSAEIHLIQPMCEVLRSPTFDLSGHPLQMVGLPKSPRCIPRNSAMGRHGTPKQDLSPLSRTTPKDTMSSSFLFPAPSTVSSNDVLKFNGRLTMEAPGVGTKIQVIMSLYSTPFDRYAVISQDRSLCKDCGYINLKNCTVQKGNAQSNNGSCKFQIGTVDGERVPLVFHADSEEDLEKWIRTLEQVTCKPESIIKATSPARLVSVSPRSRGSHSKPLLSLSALEEEDEEEESTEE